MNQKVSDQVDCKCATWSFVSIHAWMGVPRLLVRIGVVIMSFPITVNTELVGFKVLTLVASHCG